MLTINEGFYTPRQLALELRNKLNYYTAVQTNASYNNFIVVYNEVTHKLQFGNKLEAFELNFDAVISYDVSCDCNMICFILLLKCYYDCILMLC